MDSAAVHREVIALIGKDELQKAAELLAAYWEVKHQELYEASLAQTRRLHTLGQKRIKGIVSEEQANLEHARITDALLAISHQLSTDSPKMPDGFPEEPTEVRPWGKYAWPTTLAVIAVIASVIWMLNNKGGGSPFMLTLNLQSLENAEPITGGKVKVVLGDYHLAPKDLNSDGQVIFDNIPAAYLDDTLRVVPIDLAYVVKSQSVDLPLQSRQVTVNMVPRPDTTIWKGTVIDRDRRGIPGARIDINSGTAIEVSDTDGNFSIPIPLPANSRVQVQVRINGELWYDKLNVISETVSATIPISDPG